MHAGGAPSAREKVSHCPKNQDRTGHSADRAKNRPGKRAGARVPTLADAVPGGAQDALSSATKS